MAVEKERVDSMNGGTGKWDLLTSDQERRRRGQRRGRRTALRGAARAHAKHERDGRAAQRRSGASSGAAKLWEPRRTEGASTREIRPAMHVSTFK